MFLVQKKAALGLRLDLCLANYLESAKLEGIFWKPLTTSENQKTNCANITQTKKSSTKDTASQYAVLKAGTRYRISWSAK